MTMRAHQARSDRQLFCALLALTTAVAATARAEPPRLTCTPRRASVELMPWLSVGGAHRARGDEGETHATVALDGAATFPLLEAFRVGPWGHAGSGGFRTFQAAGGVRFDLTLASDVRAFATSGAWALALDAGVGTTLGSALPGSDRPAATARIGFGFRTPLRLYGMYDETCECRSTTSLAASSWTCRPGVGALSGFRVFVGGARSLGGERVWEISAGLEVEPIGLGWLVLGAN